MTMARRLETRGSKCRSCQSPIAWGKTQNDKLIPLDPDPVTNGNIAVTGVQHRARGPLFTVRVFGDTSAAAMDRAAAVADGAGLYVAHFTSCPHALQHRRPRAAA